MYGPTREQLAQQVAINAIHDFLASNRDLGYHATRAGAMLAAGYAAEDPKRMILEAIKAHESRDALCAALTGPYAQVALASLAWLFPQWRPAFQVLVLAGQVYCQERDRTTAIWTVAIVGIAGVVLAALGGKGTGGVR
jgi:hypothetical protein